MATEKLNEHLIEVDGKVRIETAHDGRAYVYALEPVLADVESTEATRWVEKGAFPTPEDAASLVQALLNA